MAFLNFATNRLLGTQEMNRFLKFIEEDGFRKLNNIDVGAYGIVRQTSDTNFNSFKVEGGTNTATIKIANESFAINSDGNIITQSAFDNLALPANDVWYWIKISHSFSAIEKGTIDISTTGVVTGTNTEFTKIFRGGKKFSKISFSASSNTGEYQVLEVVSDTEMTLSGNFVAETGIKFRNIGTFANNITVSNDDKYIFQYDSCDINFISETITNTAPTKIDDLEFFIARVQYNSTSETLLIEDKREEIYSSKAFSEFSEFDSYFSNTMPITGVEQVTWNFDESPKHENIVRIGWGFRSSSYTIDPKLRQITVNSGSGGVMRSTDDFVTGDFDGYRVYSSLLGTYYKITTSVKSGSSIILNVPGLIADKFLLSSLTIVPDADYVDFTFSPFTTISAQSKVTRKQITCPIYFGFFDLKLGVSSSSSSSYDLTHRFRKGGFVSNFITLKQDTVGYYDESSFTNLGDLKSNEGDRNRVPYTPSLISTGWLKLTAHPESYTNFTSKVDLGDLLTVNKRTLSFNDTQIDLTVGTDSLFQIFSGNLVLSQDLAINVETNSNPKAGNRFVLIIDANITLNNNNVIIAGNLNKGGSNILTLTKTDVDYAKWSNKRLVIECIYDGTVWNPYYIEKDSYQLGQVVMLANIDLGNFNGSGLGNDGTEYESLQLMNGNNGSVDISDRFIKGFESGVSNVGDLGGSHTKIINKENLPPHTHGAGTLTTDENTHSHKIFLRNSGSGVGSYRDAEFGRGGDDRLADPIRGTSTDQNIHSHSVAGATSDGSEAGINNTALNIEPKYLVLGFLQRIEKP